MNYNLISQLVSNGLDGDQILPLLLKNAPHLAKKIKQLLGGGWGSNEVLAALQQDPQMGKVHLRNGTPSTPEEIAALKVYQGRRNPDKSRDQKALESLRKITGYALKTGAAVGAGYLGSKAIQAGLGALGQALPQGASGQTPPAPQLPPAPPAPNPAAGAGVQQTPNPALKTPQPQINPSPAPQIGAGIQSQAQAPVNQAMQPGATPSPASVGQVTNNTATNGQDIGQILEQAGIKDTIDNLRRNNPPDVIAQLVRNQMGKNSQAIEQATQKPLEQSIEEYIQTAPPVPSSEEQYKANAAKAITTKGMEPVKPEEEKPKRALDVQISKAGKITPLTEKTHNAAFGQERPNTIGEYRRLSDVTYEDKYKNLSPEEKQSFKIIDSAIDRTAKHLVSGKTFQDLLPIKADSKIQLSTAEDVLRALVGVPSKYNLMTPEEQEETFNTFQGLTPNVIWNTISLIDPRIQKVQRPNPSPKGAKEGKTEMTPNDFRRFLAHSVLGLMEKHKDFGDRARMITSVVDMIEKFDMRKSTSEMFPELQSLSDEELNRMLANVPEEEVRKIR